VTGFPLLLIGLLGLMIGSFLNVCISRLPAGQSVVAPRSRCPSCKSEIAWYDNIPIVSYLILRGRCRRCGASISVRYPIVEGVTAIAFVLQALNTGDPLVLGERLAFTAVLVALFGTDLETHRLPNVLTIGGVAAGLLLSLWLPPGIRDALIGAAVGAGILFGVRWAWHRATGVEAMGLGDVKMLAMIGAFLGWQQVWVVLVFASVTGAVLGIALIAFGGRSFQSRLPFGTFLAIAAFAASLLGQRLVDWYLGLLA
jgi:leader peptidase (prepilin peptidase)/N-methyltransferase